MNIKIDIYTKYVYDEDNIENIDILDKEFTLKDSMYISDDLILKINDNCLEVIKNKDIYYHKIYKLNEETKSILRFNGNEIITKIKTHFFEKLKKIYIIKSSEYTENNEKLLDLEIKIKIKGE